MTISPIRFQVSKPVLMGREKEYVIDAVNSGWISSTGPYLTRFERAASDFLRLQDGIAVANGTAAMHLACLAMELKAGDEVIVPTLTYIASVNAIAYCGGKAVFADSDSGTWNVNLETIKAAVTPRTTGVILVHLYGMPAPAPEIVAWCRKQGLWVVEDCAEAFGAMINGRPVGSFGDAAAFSFYGNKIVSTGEGGMIFVTDAERRSRVKLLKGQGMEPNRRYWHSVLGYNYRMTNVAAAIGLGQIECARQHLDERLRIAKSYRNHLSGLMAADLVRMQDEMAGYHNVHWLSSIVIPKGDATTRNRVMSSLLNDHGIETRPFFVPNHQMPMYNHGQTFPVAERLGDTGMNLPSYTGLQEENIVDICRHIDATVRRECEVKRSQDMK